MPKPEAIIVGAGPAGLASAMAMRAAGIEVVTGMLTAEADAMQAGFLSRIRLGRPMVTLKLATTLDGRPLEIDRDHDGRIVADIVSAYEAVAR